MSEDRWETSEVKRIEKHFLVSHEIRQERIKVCDSCEHIHRWKYCKLCWCFMPLKTHMTTSSCPIGKWGPA